jgi:hypothetical protein
MELTTWENRPDTYVILVVGGSHYDSMQQM